MSRSHAPHPPPYSHAPHPTRSVSPEIEGSRPQLEDRQDEKFALSLCPDVKEPRGVAGAISRGDGKRMAAQFPQAS